MRGRFSGNAEAAREAGETRITQLRQVAGRRAVNVNGQELNVLLIVDRAGSFATVTRKLEKNGCRCTFADSYEAAKGMVQAGSYELIFSAVPPRDNALSSLTQALAGTQASVFYVHPVEDGCWWLPALLNGLPCFGAPAMRPAEFIGLLDQVVEDARSRRALGQRQPAPKFLPPQDRPKMEPDKSAQRQSPAAA